MAESLMWEGILAMVSLVVLTDRPLSHPQFAKELSVWSGLDGCQFERQLSQAP